MNSIFEIIGQFFVFVSVFAKNTVFFLSSRWQGLTKGKDSATGEGELGMSPHSTGEGELGMSPHSTGEGEFGMSPHYTDYHIDYSDASFPSVYDRD